MGDTRRGCLGCLVVLGLAVTAWVVLIASIILVIYAVKA